MNAFAMIMLSRAEVTKEGGSVAAGIDWYEPVERCGMSSSVRRCDTEGRRCTKRAFSPN